MADWDEDARARLRAAAYRLDVAGGFEVLAGRPQAPVLQYAGDVLLAALRRRPRPAGAERAATECVGGLDGRGGPGDAELAAELRAVLAGTSTGLTEVPVELGALGARLAADPSGPSGPSGGSVQVVDLRTGDIGDPDPEAFDPDAIGYEPGRWLTFVPDGPGPGRPGQGTEGEVSAEEEQRGRARRWLASHGYRPGPRPFL